MMMRYLLFILLTCTGAAGWPQMAVAVGQNPMGFFNNPEEAPPQPPQEMPPLPPDAIMEDDLSPSPEEGQQQPPPPVYGGNYYPQQQLFPALPPSRPCVAQDLRKVWKLVNVYEEPYGAEATNFAAQPYQYLIFEKNNIYSKYNSATVQPTAGMLAEAANRQDGLHQYLLNDSGVIYFYSQGVAVDSQACFIVANERGEFKLGQMLLIPPKGQHPGRLVKIYARQRIAKGPRVPGAGRAR